MALELCCYDLIDGQTPAYVVNGGYFPDSQNCLIGLCEDAPVELTRLTQASLKTHLVDMHNAQAFIDVFGNQLNQAQVETLSDNFYNSIVP